MTQVMDRAAMLETVEQSPRAVLAQDRKAWLNMFAQLAVIEDPVGSAPHISGIFDPYSGRRGNDALCRFYDTFIDGNHIEFLVDADYVVGNKVLRDLALKLEVNGMHATVPMHLLYELVPENEELKVQRLAAHWEFFPMSRQMMNSNWKGMLGYSRKLISGLGVAGVLGFTRAMRSVGSNGKQLVTAFIEANNTQHIGRLEALFDSRARGVVYEDDGSYLTPSDFLALGTHLHGTKLICAGNRISCSLEIERNGQLRNAAALFEFNWQSRKIDNVQFFIAPEE